MVTFPMFLNSNQNTSAQNIKSPTGALIAASMATAISIVAAFLQNVLARQCLSSLASEKGAQAALAFFAPVELSTFPSSLRLLAHFVLCCWTTARFGLILGLSR